MRLKVQLAAAKLSETVYGRCQQATASALAALGYSHFGQLVAPIAVVLECNGADNLSAFSSENYRSTRIQYVGLRVAQSL